MSKLLSILFVFSILILSSCKKKDSDDGSTMNPGNVDPVVVDLLCEGDGTNRYFPLEVGYKWELESSIGTTMEYEIVGTVIEDGFTYYQMVFMEFLGSTQIGEDWTELYRVGADGSIYEKFENGDEDLFIPGNPQVGDEWPYTNFLGFVGSRKVQSLEHTHSENSCPSDYTNCLRIARYNDTNDFLGFDIYHLGIGKVNSNLLSFTDE